MSSDRYMRARPVDFCAFTLLEVLVTIVVLSIAATSIMGVFINLGKSSADPMIQQQALSIAEAYMEEILTKQFCEDPPLCASETGSEEANRSLYDDIQDYNGLSDSGARDQANPATVITGLSAYDIAVSVGGRQLTGSQTITTANSMRIDVTVSHSAISPITLSGFRTNY